MSDAIARATRRTDDVTPTLVRRVDVPFDIHLDDLGAAVASARPGD